MVLSLVWTVPSILRGPAAVLTVCSAGKLLTDIAPRLIEVTSIAPDTYTGFSIEEVTCSAPEVLRAFSQSLPFQKSWEGHVTDQDATRDSCWLRHYRSNYRTA